MKSKFLTVVILASSIISCLVGCGEKEITSSESVTTSKEVGTENNNTSKIILTKDKDEQETPNGEEFMTEVLENFESQEYVVINITTKTNTADASVKSETDVHEVLYDWKNDTACTFSEDSGITYYDFTTNMAYVSNEDMTGFYKSESANVKDYYMSLYNSVLKLWMDTNKDFTVDFYDGNDSALAGYYVAYNKYSNNDGDCFWELDVLVNPDTMLPKTIDIFESTPGEDITLEDGTQMTGEEFLSKSTKYEFQFLTEDSEDFATFKSAVQLPADDECTTVITDNTTE